MDGQPGRWGWWWRNAPRAWARGGESGKPGEHCRPPGKTGEQTREPAPPVGRDDPRGRPSSTTFLGSSFPWLLSQALSSHPARSLD
ncbi:uncharacterized protein PS065_017414 isoform 4-T4 [Dugong dugon]